MVRKGTRMAEEETSTSAEAEESHELAVAPIGRLVGKYSRITMQGMIAQIIMVILEGLIMGNGLGAEGLACVGIIMSVEYINLAFGSLFSTAVPTVVGNAFGAGGEGHLRLSFGGEEDEINQAFDRIERWLRQGTK